MHHYTILETLCALLHGTEDCLCTTTRYWRLSVRYYTLLENPPVRYYAVLETLSVRYYTVLETLSVRYYTVLETLSGRYYTVLETLSGRYYTVLETLSRRYYAVLETLSVRVICCVLGLHFPADVSRAAFRHSLVCPCVRGWNVVCPRSAPSTS